MLTDLKYYNKTLLKRQIHIKMHERYECRLSAKLLKKAVAELNEPSDNEIRLAAMDSLRTRFIEADNGLDLIRSDDSFILRFLRVKKFDQDRAYQCLENYHKHRKDWPEVFDKVDSPWPLSHYLDLGPVLPLGRVAKDGTYVLQGSIGLGYDENIDTNSYAAAFVLSIEKLLEDEAFQIHGLTVIDNLINFGVTQAVQMVGVGDKFTHLMQNCMPVRLKSINLLNEGRVFDVIYIIISKFMSEKMKNRLHLHGDKLDKLHEMIPKDKLPERFGGTARGICPEEWRKQLINSLGEGEDTEL